MRWGSGVYRFEAAKYRQRFQPVAVSNPRPPHVSIPEFAFALSLHHEDGPHFPLRTDTHRHL